MLRSPEPQEVSGRIPSFNDFSPGLLKGDLRPALQLIQQHQGNDKAIIDAWSNLLFGGKKNKRSSTNVPATLKSTGLSTGTRPMRLSDVGEKVLAAKSAEEAAFVFCSHILKEKNGMLLLRALESLRARGIKAKKDTLQNELKIYGVKLSTATTDHTTLKNWLLVAGLIDESGVPNEIKIKEACGISVAEADEFDLLPVPQQVFLQALRRAHVTGEGPFTVSSVLTECLEQHPELFDADQFAKKIRTPLVNAGWITVGSLSGSAFGGKSGKVTGTSKLLDIPENRFIPDFDSAIPADLKAKLKTPLSQLELDLKSSNTHVGGLALELLALKMVLDLGLDPREFRLRCSDTAYAEVDLVAEGAHLMFSRWVIQCKRFSSSRTKVQLSDVAKEVGIAVYSKAHVVVVVTTSDFTSSARDYATEVSQSLPIQFLLISGRQVEDYLRKGRETLRHFAKANAKSVMALKRGQGLAPKDQ